MSACMRDPDGRAISKCLGLAQPLLKGPGMMANNQENSRGKRQRVADQPPAQQQTPSPMKGQSISPSALADGGMSEVPVQEAVAAKDEYFKQQPVLPGSEIAAESATDSLESGAPNRRDDTAGPALVQDYVRELQQE